MCKITNHHKTDFSIKVSIIVVKVQFHPFSRFHFLNGHNLFSVFVHMHQSTTVNFSIKSLQKIYKFGNNYASLITKTKTWLSVSGHGWLTWIRFQLQWKVRFWGGARYRRSEVEGLPTTPIILCVVVSRSVSRSYVTLSVSGSYVTRLFEVDTDF